MRSRLRYVFSLATLMMLATAAGWPQMAPAPPPEQTSANSASQVRIVRLSQVRGKVQLDRNTDQKFEQAFANLPIVSGEQLETLEGGLAEVEFEDNSSLRITPNSLIEFPVLGRDAAGATTTTVKLLKGTLYVSLVETKQATGSFAINAGNERITLTSSSHLRIDVAGNSAKLVVFKGSVTLEDPPGVMEARKNKPVSFDMVSGAAPFLAHNSEPGLFDDWDKDATAYHQLRSSSSVTNASPYAYGTTDLANYGAFTNVAGCGSMWQPYLATAGWSPYAIGVWSWYPGSGYSWVSPYPWGWVPFHSGSWELCPSNGSWGWRPNGTWNGLNNTLLQSVKGPGRPLPPAPPKRGQATLVGVNLKAMPISGASDDTFTFRANSAGLGVPRGVFNLGRISKSVARNGVASTTLSETQARGGLLAANNRASTTSVGARSSNQAAFSHASSSMAATSSVAHAPSGASAGSGGSARSGGGHH